MRYLAAPMTQRIEEYLALAGHGADAAGPVFRPVTNNRTKELEKPLNPNSVYRNIVQKYGLESGIKAQVNGLCVALIARDGRDKRAVA